MRLHVRLGIAAAAVAALAGMSVARADETSDRIARATAKLNEIDRLIDGIKARNEAGGGVAVAKVESVKCDACGMMMSSQPKEGFRAVKIKGKTYYCCKGCDMSKQVDK